jgi:hypothetical protein
MITPSEVINLALTRNVSVEHFTKNDINAAVWKYVRGYLGTSLYAAIIDDLLAYEDFIKDYIKPVLAYGIVCDTFNRIASEVSDKGVVTLLTEGATVLDSDSRARTKDEFLEVLTVLLEKMITHCDEEKSDGNALFEDYEDQEFDYTGFGGGYYENRSQL